MQLWRIVFRDLTSYLAFFEGLVGVDADIDAVGRKINAPFIYNFFCRYSRSRRNPVVL